MHLQADPIVDGIGIIHLSGRIKHASDLHPIMNCAQTLQGDGAKGIILDFNRCRNASYAGIAALTELAARLPKVTLAYSGLNAKIKRRLERTGLDGGLALFPTRQAALADPSFQAIRLSKTQVIVPCPNFGNIFRPLLDVLGKPALIRTIESLRRQGLENVLIQSAGQGCAIDQVLAEHLPSRDRIWLSNSGSTRINPEQINQGAKFDLTTTLRDLKERHGRFNTDILVLRGDHFTTANLGLLFTKHRNAGADLTMTTDTLHSAFIMRPSVLDLLCAQRDGGRLSDPLRCLQAAQGKIHKVSLQADSYNLREWPHYAALLRKALKGEVQNCAPTGRQIDDNIWCSTEATLSRGARITGPCYIGHQAIVARGSELRGESVIGNRSQIEGRTLLQDCIVASDTCVPSGAWGEHLIMTPHWAIDYRYKSQDAAHMATASETCIKAHHIAKARYA